MTTGLSPVATGFSLLDAIIEGLRSTDLVIVASRPGMRKTEFCLQIASHVALQGQIAAYVSLYQTQQEITQQVLAVASQVPLYRIKSGDISPLEKDNLTRAMESLPELPLWVETVETEEAGLTTTELQTRLRDLHQQQSFPLGLVVVDYLQLLRWQETEDEVPGDVVLPLLKTLAQDLNCPIVGICQLPREENGRILPRPTLFDLKQYDEAIDQDADVILLLHRPRPSDIPAAYESMDLIVSRKDHTKAATLALRLDPELHCFQEQTSEINPDLIPSYQA